VPRIGSASFLCLPIGAGDRVIGVINMAKRKGGGEAHPQPFSAIDLQFLNTLMTSIGYAVDNARLLDEAQESARRLQTVVDDLKATQEQLVRGETLRAIGQPASGMAHHLNNLFAVILGRTELLLGTTTEAPSLAGRSRSFGAPPRMAPTSHAACSDSAVCIRSPSRWRWT